MDRKDVRWLSTAEQQSWRAHLEATQLLFDALDRQLQRDAGLSHADYEILVRLSEAPGRQLRMSVLAESTLFSRSRLSHAVARLERAGWVRRESCADDGRGTVAVLTDAGCDVLVAAAPGHVRAVREHLIDRLTPTQVSQLRELSDVVREGLAGQGTDGSRSCDLAR